MKLLKTAEQAYTNLIDNVDDWRNRDKYESEIQSQPKLTRAYSLNCTGDVCAGDKIAFITRKWEKRTINRFGKKANVVVGYELLCGEVIKESYGRDAQQHTFTIQLDDGEKMLIKGRNLYAVGVWRKPWKDEEARKEALDDKHFRGRLARRAQRARRGAFI